MPNSPNRLSQFWQELKRRKVIRVITVYAAAAFVILELLSIIIEPLRLPDWTLQFAIVFLCIGFIIAIIFSWIYDIHPEGGLVKTEPARNVKDEDTPKSSNGWKISSYISFVVIVVLVILNIIPRTQREVETETPDKSIAVLPFRNESLEEQNTYFINGVMEAILDNLCKIKDLRVPGRTSVEQYRYVARPIPMIAKEMDVSYVLEGSGQKIGNRVLLTLQLIDAINDHHLWSKQYDREIKKITDLIDIQSEVAQLVASEIEAIITPDEERLIKKIPTTNSTAYDFYQQGRDEHWKYWLRDDNEALDRAENRYHKALEFDSTFAHAYTGLAEVYWDRHFWKEYFTEEFLDSFLILINIALSYDDQLAEAYRFRGSYYEAKGKPEQALNEYNKAIRYNPNDWKAYRNIAYLNDEEPIVYIKHLQKALSLNQGPQSSYSLRNLGRAYINLGFIEKGMNFYQEAYALDQDTIAHLWGLAFAEFSLERFEETLEIGRTLHILDSTILVPPLIFNLTGHHEEIYSIYKTVLKSRNPDWIPLQNAHRIGVALWKMGKYEEAERFFNQQVQYCSESIELGRSIESWGAAYYDLGAAYACLGEKQKAIEYLKECDKRKFYPLWWVVQWKIDPLFENIRDEPEYQEIVRDVEAKYQVEHERVRQWLEENDML